MPRAPRLQNQNADIATPARVAVVTCNHTAASTRASTHVDEPLVEAERLGHANAQRGVGGARLLDELRNVAARVAARAQEVGAHHHFARAARRAALEPRRERRLRELHVRHLDDRAGESRANRVRDPIEHAVGLGELAAVIDEQDRARHQ